MASCPSAKGLILSFAVPNANPGVPPGCAGSVDIDARPSGGGATIRWQAIEMDPSDGCRQVGPQMSGAATVQGSCCEEIIDVHFPKGDFTFRFALRTDWQR